MISYDQWMKDTSRIARPRSVELRAVDAAFLQFEKLGTADAKSALQQALTAWKDKEGPGDAWRRSARNGNRAVEKLIGRLEGKSDSDSAFNLGRVPDFMHEELINARLGVLYLFSRLSVTPGIFKLVLDGGLDLASQGLDLAGKGTAKTWVDRAAKGTGALEKPATALEQRIFTGGTASNVPLPPGAAPSLDLTPKEVTAGQLTANANQLANYPTTPLLQKLEDKVGEFFHALADKVMALLKEKFLTLEGFSGTIKTVIKACVKFFAAHAAPFVSGALDIASAVGKTVDAAVTRFRTWKEGRDVEVADGHPGIVVQSIQRAMTLALFDGLWQAIKGAGSLAMDIVGFGAGGLVNIIVSAGELLIKFLWRLGETLFFNRFCTQAAGHWANHASPDSIARRPFAFSEWYRPYALHLPLIAVLTLNTGICGDKMRYLTMFKSGGEQLTSDAFQRGVTFLDNLKPWGAKYIQATGFSMHAPGDILVARLVSDFASSHSKEKTAFDRVIEVVTA
jgi:hypothetical protein